MFMVTSDNTYIDDGSFFYIIMFLFHFSVFDSIYFEKDSVVTEII